jgi:hypothetical protein
MGTRTDQAEREVSAQRTRISQMLDELEQRTRHDIEGVEHRVSAQTAEIKNRAAGTLKTEKVSEQVTQHPLSSIMLGFGAGIALGIVSGAATGDERRPVSAGQRMKRASLRRDDEREQDEAGGMFAGLISGATASALSAVMTPVRDELQTMLRQAIAGFTGTGREREQAERMPIDRDDRSERRVRERERVSGSGVERDVERSAT